MTLIIVTPTGMVADSRALTGDQFCLVSSPKISRCLAGIVGASGATTLCTEFMNEFLEGKIPKSLRTSPEDYEKFCGVVLLNSGVLQIWDSLCRVYVEKCFPFMCGSLTASNMAFGAMSAGATARRAMEIAIENCITIGGPIVELEL